jgi:GrpB-like predicted nucleotidyltransferase (UPF0157 family)
MPVSEKRKEQMKVYRSTRKEQQRFYFERYLAKHPNFAETRKQRYNTKKKMCEKLMNIQILVQTFEQDQTLTDSEKLQQILDSLKEEEDVTNEFN